MISSSERACPLHPGPAASNHAVYLREIDAEIIKRGTKPLEMKIISEQIQALGEVLGARNADSESGSRNARLRHHRSVAKSIR